MKEHPIFFNTPMVQAIQEGRKTMTRRVIKSKLICVPLCDYSNPFDGKRQPYIRTSLDGFHFSGFSRDPRIPKRITESQIFYINKKGWYAIFENDNHTEKIYTKCPYEDYDILWVRETWQHSFNLDENDQIIEGTGRYIYKASPKDWPYFTHWLDSNTGLHRDTMPWRPSIHMPKETARIFLKVTDVSVERLQDISIENARKEGIEIALNNTNFMYQFNFRILWDTINAKRGYSWDSNPWVWVVNFEKSEESKCI